MKKKKKEPHYRWWKGLWYEPATEHITDHRAWHTYRPLRGKAVRRQLFGEVSL